MRFLLNLFSRIVMSLLPNNQIEAFSAKHYIPKGVPDPQADASQRHCKWLPHDLASKHLGCGSRMVFGDNHGDRTIPKCFSMFQQSA